MPGQEKDNLLIDYKIFETNQFEEERELEQVKETLSNLIETAALAKIREQQFVDDAEMAEILANQNLVERIRKGSGDARARKGQFID